MISFLLAFLAVYSGMHALVVLRFWPLLPQAWNLRCLLWCFGLLMIVSPIVTYWLDDAGYHLPASLLAWVGFTWMGFVFVAFCLGLALYCLEGMGLLVKFLFSSPGQTFLPPQPKAFLLLGLTLVVLSIAFWQAREIKVQEIEISSPKLSFREKGVTLVQISDLHLGLLAGKRRVEKISDLLHDLQPDILVCTGDFIDSNPQGLVHLDRRLQEFPASWGKFAVTGNHETYVGLDAAGEFLDRAGFVMLEGRIWRKDGIALAGVAYSRRQDCSGERKLMDRFKDEDFNVLLKHSPQVCPHSDQYFDLQLSGHTHKGQIFPFSLVTKIVYPYLAGMYSLANGSAIYVNQGTGTWGPQMRLFTKQEITVFKIDGTAKSRFSVISNKGVN